MSAAPQTKPVRIATRGSRLALWQANWVRSRLEAFGAAVSLEVIETQGDRDHAPFKAMQGQAFFTKAVQDAVLEGRADLAVHSLKDLPSATAPGLVLAAIPAREDVRDVLLARPEGADETRALGLRANAVVGTSAVRRRAQIAASRPDLEVRELRGNVPTRVEKLRRGEYEAIVLAAAGLNRLALGLDDLRLTTLEPRVFVPAPGQGALALECRADDERTRSLLAPLEDPKARLTVSAERGLMARLHGGCQLALGAHARPDGSGLELIAWYGGRVYEARGPNTDAVIERAYRQIEADHAEVRA